jgi:hypothetical protein
MQIITVVIKKGFRALVPTASMALVIAATVGMGAVVRRSYG